MRGDSLLFLLLASCSFLLLASCSSVAAPRDVPSEAAGEPAPQIVVPSASSAPAPIEGYLDHAVCIGPVLTRDPPHEASCCCAEEGSAMNDVPALECMVEAIREVRFPAGGQADRDMCGLISLHYPVVFEQ